MTSRGSNLQGSLGVALTLDIGEVIDIELLVAKLLWLTTLRLNNLLSIYRCCHIHQALHT
jgi:hypothetical protein